jgi:hypothetical protein
MPRKRPDEPLFDTRRYATRSGRTTSALDAVRVAVLRTLAEAIDIDVRRLDTSSYTLATATRTLTELFNALAAGAEAPDAFDDLVAALSAPPGPPAP